MTWNEYTSAILPLLQKFGKHIYPKEQIDNGFKLWRTETQSLLIKTVNEAIDINMSFRLDNDSLLAKLNNKTIEVKHNNIPTKIIDPETKELKQIRNDDFLSRYLAMNNVKDAVELLQKEINRIKKA